MENRTVSMYGNRKPKSAPHRPIHTIIETHKFAPHRRKTRHLENPTAVRIHTAKCLALLYTEIENRYFLYLVYFSIYLAPGITYDMYKLVLYQHVRRQASVKQSVKAVRNALLSV